MKNFPSQYVKDRCFFDYLFLTSETLNRNGLQKYYIFLT